VLYNPAAGQGSSLRRLPTFERTIARKGIPYELVVTTSEEELRLLARDAPEHYDRVIVAGGDTTFAIVVSEFLHRETKGIALPPLGFAGMGSANDLCRGLGLDSLSTLCDAMHDNLTRRMSVGQVETEGDERVLLFLSSMSLGLGVSVNRHIGRIFETYPWLARHRHLGQFLAGMAGVRRSLKRDDLPQTLTLAWNRNRRKMLYSLLVFLNTGTYANGIPLAPDADAFDTRLVCAAVRTRTLGETLSFYRAAKKGRHLVRREFEMVRASRFVFRSLTPVDIQLDGQIHEGIRGAEVSVLPRRLEVFVGRSKME